MIHSLRPANTFRWVEFCRSALVLGKMENFSKGECFKMAAELQVLIEAGKVIRLQRGLYQLVESAWPALSMSTTEFPR
jgi:hypothetical protein